MPRAAPKRPDRRGLIARALYACMSKQGYASTTLKDVADQAGMSASHVGYYFDNKAAILEHYTVGLCEQVLGALPELEQDDPDRLVERVADYFLGAGQTGATLLGVVQEISGLAVHDPTLNGIKTRHSTAIRRYLEALFESTKADTGIPAREAAWRAHAVLVGLNANTLFDRNLNRAKALEIFHETLLTLAGLDRPKRGRSRKERR